MFCSAVSARYAAYVLEENCIGCDSGSVRQQQFNTQYCSLFPLAHCTAAVRALDYSSDSMCGVPHQVITPQQSTLSIDLHFCQYIMCRHDRSPQHKEPNCFPASLAVVFLPPLSAPSILLHPHCFQQSHGIHCACTSPVATAKHAQYSQHVLPF